MAATAIQGTGEAGVAPTQRLTSWCRGREVYLRGEMADISQFSIFIYQRKLGHWRAAITPKSRNDGVVRGEVRSLVTPDDCASESEAELAAAKLIRKLRR
jgi:hypothetical protein